MVHIDKNSVRRLVKGDLDFKELFQEAISARVGLSLVRGSAEATAWTPSLLAEALQQADPQGRGVDVRTVQNWFQDNDKGISSENIVSLARVFGMGDPQAVAAWRTELRAANKRLAFKRRAWREGARECSANQEPIGSASSSNKNAHSPAGRRGLPAVSERVFTCADGLALAMIVWAGFFLLCLVSFVVENHDATYLVRDDLYKQVGFFWSLSWPLECLLLYPGLFLLIANHLSIWKHECRKMARSGEHDTEWDDLIFGLRLPFWIAAIVAFVLIFAVQWSGVYLLGLTRDEVPNLIDWILVAQVRPDLVSPLQALVVSFLAYLYSGLIYWFYFVGLLLLFAASTDFYKRAVSLNQTLNYEVCRALGRRIQTAIFQTAVIGILAATVIQLNAIYLRSDGETSFNWLASDFLAGLGADANYWSFLDQSSVSSLTSSKLVLLHMA